MTDTLSIGEVARRAGVATSTVRYYDRLGLVPVVDRDGTGRRYDDSALRRLTVIRSFQHAGFSLDEIKELLDGAGRWQHLAREKREQLSARIQELVTAQELIDAALACGCEDLEGCPAHEERSSCP
ncbi:MerR family transcriptional regulator [Egibacter rhizosphaerae]|uniref:MerR family transcriptional regulator n=1 Tax=Egibacter rhizosphaerae TaxID=1670831 RepID=A0A411YHG9_9ACTN|nr:MerR family transcriptional regulator [Egibacter rhizosphaerae]QBI20559.1 MerR family transcriptional regulator [Egibacter rhizosphaerae]